MQSEGEYWIAEGPVTTTTCEKELTNGVPELIMICFVLLGCNIRKKTEYLLL